MITNQVAYDKKLLGNKIEGTFKEVSSLLRLHDSSETMYIMGDWHAFNDFWSKHADLAEISLEETQERLQQVTDLLERVKNL
ncbi:MULTISPECIES: hypothetical protein [Bacillus]|uniref:hypothetical protein n=1 Tax=Bacillus TaxID=1386 RepID=UPI0002D23CE4|nr:hypothetical protein [Bacillus sp. GeD10]HEF1857076.1 hypothetical protein [Bacillus cereus]CCW08550.1 hypothetical protein EBGED10_52950 [Bacillus sp. GeD10]HEF1869404.1 hypothetical protein [Bacillus cereus]HEF1879968.1 hypothetical protein [Bacillus cereus]HEF1886051.1 hypothetical protein [Bacillus cereus]